MLKNAILFAICAVAIATLAPQVLFHGFEPQGATARIVAVAPSPPPAQPPASLGAQESAGFREAVLSANPNGQYYVDALINGQSVPMVVDTGASMVYLSWRTAERLGVVPDPSGRRYRVATANGLSTASAATVSAISFQGIYMNDVEAMIAPPEVATADLLGTSFIKRLASVEQRDGLLFLRQ